MTAETKLYQLRMLIAAGLIALTLATFWQVGENQFTVYDDPSYITQNLMVRNGVTAESIRWAFTTPAAGNWHPVTWISHMLDCQLFGLAPGAHHWMNLLWHLANTLLVFVVFERYLSPTRQIAARQVSARGLQPTGWASSPIAGVQSEQQAMWVAAFLAAIFAVHPLRVESVAWASERKDVLSGFFWLTTMLAYERYARTGRIGWYVATAGSLLLGLLAKPMLVTFPAALLLLDYWPLGRLCDAEGRWNGAAVRRAVAEKLPLLALAIVSSAITYAVQSRGGAVMGSTLPFLQRMGSVVEGYSWYLHHTFWPVGLCYFYPLRPEIVRFGNAQNVAIGIAEIVVISVIVYRQRVARPYLAVGWLWFLGTLVPVVNFVKVGDQAYADRYMYVPHLGLSLVLALLAAEVVARTAGLRVAISVAAAVAIAACAVLSFRQVRTWHDDIALADQALANTPDNFQAHFVRGAGLQVAGRESEAAAEFRKSVEINPGFVIGLVNLGYSQLFEGDPDQALASFEQALKKEDDSPQAWAGMAAVAAHKLDFEAAKKAYARAIEIEPSRGEFYDNLGDVLRALHQPQQALAAYEQAIRLETSTQDTPRKAAAAVFELGDAPRAERMLVELVAKSPDDAALNHQLADALLQQGKFAAAIGALKKSLAADSSQVTVANNLAWILATSADPALRDGAESLRLAQEFCQSPATPPELLDTLAAAQAETGDYPAAVATVDRALALVTDDPPLVEELQSRRTLYAQSTPYRDPSGPRPPEGDATSP